MDKPAQKAQSPILINVILIGVFLIGLAIVVVAAREIIKDRTLGNGAVTADARVTELRKTTSRKSGDSYQVRYAFEVGGQKYTYKDETGRADLWATISQDAWEVARQKGIIAVTYLPADPWANRAVARASDGLFGQIAGLVVGLLCMLPTLLWAISALRRRRRLPNGQVSPRSN
jgi:hypothetical protein